MSGLAHPARFDSTGYGDIYAWRARRNGGSMGRARPAALAGSRQVSLNL